MTEMRSRIFFLTIAGFWVVMNYLLWRSQWGAHSGIGSAVPVGVVWEKILTAPDSSSLEIYDHDKKIGFSHWIATVGNSPIASTKNLSEDDVPEGMVGQVTGYSLDFEGNSFWPESNRIRFEAGLTLSTNREWKDFRLHVNLRPTVWDVRASAASEKVVVHVNDPDGSWQKTFKFADLQDPEALLGDFGGGYALGLLGGAGLPLQKDSLPKLAVLNWQAHEDWMQVGHSKVRVYRLETQFFGQHVFLFISRVGEILRVELPNKIALRNEAFGHF